MTEEGNLASVIAPDLGKQRGLSKATLDLFNVSVNGTGWYWQTKVKGGGSATRWKSFYSHKADVPEDARKGWKKYQWMPNQPEGADYFCAPSMSLTGLIKANEGELWLVGGEVAAMTMIEAGLTNATSFFGDTMIPDTLADDLMGMGVKYLFMIPDRDESGQKCAYEVRDRLRETTIEFRCYALPFPVGSKKDANDLWLDCNRDKDCFTRKVLALEQWILPERKEDVPLLFPDIHFYDDTDLPVDFVRDVERALEVPPLYDADGWARKPVPCPFHDDDTPSAYWNNQKFILKDFGSCGQVYLAKEVGAQFGIELSHYSRVPMAKPELKIVRREDTQEVPKIKAEPPKLRPALPKEARLSSEQIEVAKSGRRWLDQYVRWACIAASATPEIFHEAMGLWLLATAATRRIKVQIGGEDIFPNLYIMIIAKTSMYRKSTGMKKAISVLMKANLDVLRLPSEATPEALFDELAGIKPINFDRLTTDVQRRWLLGRAFAAQKAIVKDEASSILASLRKEYMGGLTELLLQGYDSDAGVIDKRLQSKGLISIKDLSLSFLGATTPTMWAKYVGTEENENGLTPRFAIITPEGPPKKGMSGEVVNIPDVLVNEIRRIFLEVLPGDYVTVKPTDEIMTPPVACASLSPNAFKQLEAYRDALGFDMLADGSVDERLAPAYSRLGTMAYKIAMLLCLADSQRDIIRVEDRHAYAAILISERWRESLHRLDNVVAKSQDDGILDRICRYIEAAGDVGVTLRDIMKDCNIKKASDAQDKLKVIAEEGKLERYERKPAGRGRPAMCYRMISD